MRFEKRTTQRSDGRKMKKHFMARILVAVLAVSFVMPLSACKSREEKRMEELTKAAEYAEQAAAEAEREYEQLLEYMEEYEELQEKLDSLPKGSAEYERVLEKNNRLVRKMISEYPELETAVEVK